MCIELLQAKDELFVSLKCLAKYLAFNQYFVVTVWPLYSPFLGPTLYALLPTHAGYMFLFQQHALSTPDYKGHLRCIKNKLTKPSLISNGSVK